jgi:amidase
MTTWKETARQKRAQQASRIPEAWRLKSIPATFEDCRPVIESSGILTPLELEITNTTNAEVILSKISSCEWSSLAVATAFCKRAAVAQQLIGCCTEMFFYEALKRAKELDEHLDKTGTLIGPFHGLPISLKDSFEIKGQDTTIGWVGIIGQPAEQDSLAVQQFRALGAVLYCKTNVPQSLMMSDSYNHVFGQCVNALHRGLISGGSSGGEGALVGARGSFLGMGTDIGGSIRIPAVLQGLYGLCPTIGRVPNRESGRHQKYVVPPVAGPMTSSLETIELFMRGYLSSAPWESDPQLLPIPWRSELAVPTGRQLRIGYIVNDGVVFPQPPVQRVVRETAALFAAAGHEVFEWDSTPHKSAHYDLWTPAIFADGGKRCADLCKLVNEPLIEGMLVGKPEHALDVEQRQELAEKIWDYQRFYLQRWMQSGVDAVIAPVTPWPGMRPKVWAKSDQYCGYTAHWNLLNYASLAVPAGKVDKNLDIVDEEWMKYQPKSFSDKFNHEHYDVELVNGMPVGIQIVAGRFGEEKAIAVAKILQELQMKAKKQANGLMS